MTHFINKGCTSLSCMYSNFGFIGQMRRLCNLSTFCLVKVLVLFWLKRDMWLCLKPLETHQTLLFHQNSIPLMISLNLKLVAKLRLVLLTVFFISCLHCALRFQVAIVHWTVHWLKRNIFPFVKMFRKRPLGVNWQATSLILICVFFFLLPLLLSGFYLYFVIREGELCWLCVAFKLVCDKVQFFLKKDSVAKMLSNIKM